MSTTQSPKILVVDDDQAMRQLLIEYLAGHGITADGTGTVAEATAAVQEKSYDLVLLDLGLPEAMVPTWHVAGGRKRRCPSFASPAAPKKPTW